MAGRSPSCGAGAGAACICWTRWSAWAASPRRRSTSLRARLRRDFRVTKSSRDARRKGALAAHITSFSRVQLKVRAIARAVEETGVDLAKFPFIVRFAGAGGEEAREIAAGCPGLQYLGDEVTLEEAAERIIAQVEAVKRGESWTSIGGAP